MTGAFSNGARTMNRRKIIVYSIFVVVATYGFYFHFLSGETKKRTPTPVPSGDTIQAGAIAGPDLNEPVRAVSDSSANQPVLRRYKSRNPFEARNAHHEDSPTASTPVHYSRPDISAISRDGSESLVIANNKVIRIGERIGDWKLMKVESDKALFDGPEGAVWIYLGG